MALSLLQRLAQEDLGRCWDDGQPPGAGDGKSGDASRGGKPADGETRYTQAQLDDAVKVAVQKAINSRFGKDKSQEERRIATAREEAVSAFREEHGLDDESLQRVKSQQSEFDKLQRDHNKLTKDHEALVASHGELVASDRRRRVDDALGVAIADFSKKKGHRVREDARADVLASLRPRLRAEDDGSVSVLGDNGEPLHDITPGDWVAEQLESRKYALEPNVLGGGGSGRGDDGTKPPKRDLRTAQGAGDLYADIVHGK